VIVSQLKICLSSGHFLTIGPNCGRLAIAQGIHRPAYPHGSGIGLGRPESTVYIGHCHGKAHNHELPAIAQVTCMLRHG
jgi:hypothetical protein